jgi:hypothetical protein
MQLPVTVLNANTKRETGKKAQFANITAAKVLMPVAVLGWCRTLNHVLSPGRSRHRPHHSRT